MFDIEFVVFLIQWAFFIVYINSHFSIKIFTQKFWFFFTKVYFSFIIVCNPVILFIFYESETVVKLNILNIGLYFFINLVLILIISIITYIAIELPFKKIFKFLMDNCKKSNKKDISDDNDLLDNTIN